MDKITYVILQKNIRDSIPESQQQAFELQFASKEKSEAVALALSLFLGMLGIDRMYLGQILIGILKLITCGGFGIWTFIDWFLIMGAARSKNIDIANDIAARLERGNVKMTYQH